MPCSAGNAASFVGRSTASCPARLPPFLPRHGAWPGSGLAPVWSRVATGASSLGNVPLGRGDRAQGHLRPPIPGEGLEHPWVRLAGGVPVQGCDLQHPQPLPHSQEPRKSLPQPGTTAFTAGSHLPRPGCKSGCKAEAPLALSRCPALLRQASKGAPGLLDETHTGASPRAWEGRWGRSKAPHPCTPPRPIGQLPTSPHHADAGMEPHCRE